MNGCVLPLCSRENYNLYNGRTDHGPTEQNKTKILKEDKTYGKQWN